MPLQATSGAASYDAFGGGVAAVPNYIEDVFSTWLYTGNGSTQTITNGVNLSGRGGLVWLKRRDAVRNHGLFDTVRGATKLLYSDLTNAEYTDAFSLTSFNSNGFSLGLDGGGNANGGTYVSWTFREQPKFFDVVTYTGNGVAGRQIAHNLGSEPGFIAVKKTSSTGDWLVYHRSRPAKYLYLNSTAAEGDDSGGVVWGNGSTAVAPTSTNFTVNALTPFPSADINANGQTYVAYLFAHNAGGFGLTGTDNVISCGSFTTDGSEKATVSLGYEPQWVMIKAANAASDWFVMDSMRGMPVSGNGAALSPNSSSAETAADYIRPNATGFSANNLGSSLTWVYIAIRRGPMKVPTTGTSVFSANTQTGANTSAGQTITTNFPVDLEISSGRSNNSGGNYFLDRLRGSQNYIQATNVNEEVNFTAWTPLVGFANNTGITDANYGSTSSSYVAWNFRRAPNFFDEVCYTGTGGNPQTVSHNLGVAPEMVIVKRRSSGAAPNWTVGLSFTSTPYRDGLYLNATNALIANDNEINGATASTIAVRNTLSASGGTFVAYLFASCPGVSKVGNYTGTGATQVIDCGFTGGARFVLIKATSTTGNWLVWDSARGIVSGNDPYLTLNTTGNEVTNTDWVDTAASGFELSNAGGNLANSNGVSYIFLAIA
jgi:hypothetical protein